jgi:hypothetical protein
MAWTYTLATVSTHAHDFVRLLLHDVQTDRPLLQDEELDTFLALHAVTAVSDPIANASACYAAAADAARSIEAKFASEAETEITELGIVKQTASTEYRRLAAELDAKSLTGAVPSFLDPSTFPDMTAMTPSGYPNDWVAGVDPVPGLP